MKNIRMLLVLILVFFAGYAFIFSSMVGKHRQSAKPQQKSLPSDDGVPPEEKPSVLVAGTLQEKSIVGAERQNVGAPAAGLQEPLIARQSLQEMKSVPALSTGAKPTIAPEVKPLFYTPPPCETPVQTDTTAGEKKPLPLTEVGLFSGYAKGHLNRKGHYELVPLIGRFGFDLKPFLAKFRLHPRGSVLLVWEPCLNTAINPEPNIETGLAWLLKYSFHVWQKVRLFVEGGVGVAYMTQHTLEQSTQFNFIEPAGGGVQVFVRPNISLDFGYRYRHLSNASIKSPNSGVNTHMYLVGFTVHY